MTDDETWSYFNHPGNLLLPEMISSYYSSSGRDWAPSYLSDLFVFYIPSLCEIIWCFVLSCSKVQIEGEGHLHLGLLDLGMSCLSKSGQQILSGLLNHLKTHLKKCLLSYFMFYDILAHFTLFVFNNIFIFHDFY